MTNGPVGRSARTAGITNRPRTQNDPVETGPFRGRRDALDARSSYVISEGKLSGVSQPGCSG